MKDSRAVLGHVAVVTLLGSCAPSFDVPPAPDLEPVLRAYENPTVEVGREIMAEVADEIARAAEEIQDSEIFAEILDLLNDVQEELDNATALTCEGGANNGKACTGTEPAECPDGTCTGPSVLVLGGVCDGGTNPGGDCAANADCPGDPDEGIDPGTCSGGVTVTTPTGFIKVNYICPGWEVSQFDPDYLKTCKGGANDGSACTGDADCPDGTCVEAPPDSANGKIDLFMTLDSSGIGRVVWGTAARCQYLVPLEGDDCEAGGCIEASYDGGVALDLGPDWVEEDISELPVTFVVEGTIELDDDDFPINQSFRVVLADESGLVLLVDVSDPALSQPPLSQTFNYVFAETFQCIRDAIPPPDPESPCSFGCSLERRVCFDESGILFSW